MLGDVCGRGALAATTTARAVAPFMSGPQAVVQAVNHALTKRHGSHGTAFVTLVYGHFTSTKAGLDIDIDDDQAVLVLTDTVRVCYPAEGEPVVRIVLQLRSPS